MLKKTGSALVMALLIVTVLAAISIILMRLNHMAATRTAHLVHQEQVMLEAETKVEQTKAALLAHQTKYPQGVGVVDMQSRFNINLVTRDDYYTSLVNLLHIVLPADAKQEWIAGHIRNWVGGRVTHLDEDYQALKRPYPVAHQPLSDISQLRLIMGVTPAHFAALRPHLSVLPQDGVLNVNTASQIVLQALGLSAGCVDTVVQHREQQIYDTIQAFNLEPCIAANPHLPKWLSVKSQYYLIIVTDKHRIVTSALVKVDESHHQVATLSWRRGDPHV